MFDRIPTSRGDSFINLDAGPDDSVIRVDKVLGNGTEPLTNHITKL